MKTIAITGATGGIGFALAKHYAAPGVRLRLTGRKAERLSEVSQACRARGAEVETLQLDVRDEAALAAWAEEMACDTDLLILGAGVSASVEKKDERFLPERNADLLRELKVNAAGSILAANAFARAVLEKEDPGRHVQVGLISSLAAMTGLPASPGYSASKACVRTYGAALRRLLAERNVGVTVILSGYVDSAMSRRYVGAKPGLIGADEAAARFARALEENLPEYAFPWYLAWGIRALECLPEGLQKVFLKGFFFSVVPDEESRSEGKRP